MLVLIISILSVLGAAGLCLLTGVFAGPWWLLWLPLSFAGCFLLQLALAFGFLVLVCRLIDPDKPREEDCPWFRRMILWYIDAALTLLPVHLETQGLEQIPRSGRFLLVCNHLDLIDPAFILHCFPKSQLAFVAKREAKDMFLIGKVLPKLLCPYINRENDREALKTILRCIHLLKEDTVSIAIFPEGRINPYRKLAHFRPGVFKIAQKAQVPIVVCTLLGTNHVMSRLLQGKSATVRLHLLEVIPPEALRDQNTVELAERIYGQMAADLGAENVLTPQEEENA